MTMRGKRCECCWLPVASCGKAAEAKQRAEVKARRAELLRRREWFAATYPGVCARCGEWFATDTPIRKDNIKGWLAECCAEGN